MAPWSSAAGDRRDDVIDLHAHVVLESSLGAAGDLGPDARRRRRGRRAPTVLPGRRLRARRVSATAARPFMDLDRRLDGDGRGAASTSRCCRPIRSPTSPTSTSSWRRPLLPPPQRRARRARRPSARPPRRLRPAPDAGSRTGRRGAPSGPCRTSVSWRRTWAPISGAPSTIRPSTRCGPPAWTLDVPVFFHPAPDGIDRPRPRRAPGPLRRRPVARFPLRGDPGRVVAGARRGPRPPSRPRRVHQPRRGRDLLAGRAHGARGSHPTMGRRRPRGAGLRSPSVSGASGGTPTSAAPGRSPPSWPPSVPIGWWPAPTWRDGTSPAIRRGVMSSWLRRWTPTPVVCCASRSPPTSPGATTPQATDAGPVFAVPW